MCAAAVLGGLSPAGIHGVMICNELKIVGAAAVVVVVGVVVVVVVVVVAVVVDLAVDLVVDPVVDGRYR